MKRNSSFYFKTLVNINKILFYIKSIVYTTLPKISKQNTKLNFRITSTYYVITNFLHLLLTFNFDLKDQRISYSAQSKDYLRVLRIPRNCSGV